MKRDSRLSGVLHLLLHMGEGPGPLTSEALAEAMGTNPAVVRRLLAGLRKRGLVASEKGHGGGWTLLRTLAEITLLDIYEALGRPTLFAIANRREAPECRVEQAVNAAVDGALEDAEALLLARFRQVTLADVGRDFRERLAAAGLPSTAARSRLHHRMPRGRDHPTCTSSGEKPHAS